MLRTMLGSSTETMTATVHAQKNLWHRHPCLEELLLTIWNCFGFTSQMSHLRSSMIKQSYKNKGWLSLVLQLQQQSSYLACEMAHLRVMLAQVTFHSR